MTISRFEAWRAIVKRKGAANGLATLFNAVVAKAHTLCGARVHHLPFFPANMTIGIVNVCNLHCVACMAHGYPEAQALAARDPNKLMQYDQFVRILEQGGKLAHNLDLTSPGEAFLHPRLYDMVAVAARNYGIFVKIDTNGQVLDADAVVDCGLSQLVFAVDGFSQESYETYRRGGQLAKVVGNVEKLSETALRRGSGIDIQVKYLINVFTEGEVEKAREHFARLPNVRFFVEVFFPPAPSLEFCKKFPFETTPEIYEYWKTADDRHNLYYVDEGTGRCRHKCMAMPFQNICNNPFNGIYILPDGECYACCFAAGHRTAELYMGNVYEETLFEVFNGKRANDLRRAYERHDGRYSMCAVCWGNRVQIQSEACT